MCNLYSITTNQAAIAALFRVMNRYVGNLAPMPGVFPDKQECPGVLTFAKRFARCRTKIEARTSIRLGPC